MRLGTGCDEFDLEGSLSIIWQYGKCYVFMGLLD